ncbi:MAG: dihydroneopterin aldolase [Coleofasciculaceae cyanobacterium RL_1_1]|nr:dihydroneopterin aldolase [Coleofasciculaceae cyanobacterium RL_1_1]
MSNHSEIHPDRIQLRGIRSYGYTGFLAEEKVLGQWFSVDLTLDVDLQPAGQSDDLQDTVDYRAAIEIVKTTIKTECFDLVERLAQAIAERLLQLDRQRLKAVNVKLTKEAAPIPDFGGEIIIDIYRTRAS